MKKITLSLFLSIFIFATQAAISFPTPVARIDFTDNSSSLVTFVTGGSSSEAFTESSLFEGVQCRKIPSGKFLYIKCDRTAVPTISRQILISITYYDNNSNSLWFNYNGVSNNYTGADISKNGTQGWVTTIVTITDGQFAGLMNGGSDFRMGFNGSDNYIKEIKIALGSFNPDLEVIPAQINLSSNQFKGKSFAGYQIWHEAGPKASDWVHWTYGHVPGPGFHLSGGEDIASYPDVSEYDSSQLFATNLGELGDGRASGLYHSKKAAIINKQMKWLQDVDFDGVAIQRFVGGIGKSITISDESHLSNVKNACEATGRLFYICYDLNGTDATILDRMKKDWVYEIEQIRSLTSSNNYATVNGKPVVEIWGVGYDMATATQCASLISFLQGRGCYVVGGTPRDWRTSPKAGFSDVFKSLDCISPWTVGAYGDINGANNYKTSFMTGDKSYCDANGLDYLPVAFAGSANWLSSNLSLSQTDRKGGMLLWTQVLNAKSLGLSSVYYAMLDEFEESTNLIKGAVDYFDLPVNQYFETFSKNGIWVSSDYYLRLSAYTSKMLRGEKPLTTTIPVPYSEGPVYYRNSFESRYTSINMNGEGRSTTIGDYYITLPIDPCFYNPVKQESTGVNSPVCQIEAASTPYTKSGLYAVKVTGSPVSATAAYHYYKFADTKIAVKATMLLSFYKYTVNDLGRYTSVDLMFASGKRLRNLSGYSDNDGKGIHPGNGCGNVGAEWEKFTCQIGKGELLGDTITGIILGYDHPAVGETYTAYFDDIIIRDSSDDYTDVPNTTAHLNAAVYSTNGILHIRPVGNSMIRIYNISGQLIYNRQTENSISLPLEKGVYILQIESNGNIESKSVIVS